MALHSITLDQFHVFVTVVECGGFSAAARKLNRTQPAVTYAIKKLEEEVGGPLFDRTGYRSQPNARGKSLLRRAKGILAEVTHFQQQAGQLSEGLEPVVSLVIDPITPMPPLLAILKSFQLRFPSVELRLSVEALGSAIAALHDGQADLGLVVDYEGPPRDLDRAPAFDVPLVPVVAPDHPLALLERKPDRRALAQYTQLVMIDRSSYSHGRDLAMTGGTSSWRLTDMGIKHQMLLAGLGWGSLPVHMVEADIAAGRLVLLPVKAWSGSSERPVIPLFSAWSPAKEPGPATRWLHESFSAKRTGH
ncbi:MAG: transcriptional regulator, LysR family [Ramlibacter sp.]|nr:transcriptional regulator, LysR family [Ramlibacter sp.]